MRKPFPPAYAIGMDPADYDWSHHRYVQTEDGGIAVIADHSQETNSQGEETMAATKTANKKTAVPAKTAEKPTATKAPAKTAAPAKAEKPVKEKPVKENKVTFSKEVIKLMAEHKHTDAEIAEKLQPMFPDKTDVAGAIKWYRRQYNIKAQEAGEDILEEMVRDGKSLVKKSSLPPVEKPAKEPKAEKVEKPAAAAPVAKKVVKKVVKKA